MTKSHPVGEAKLPELTRAERNAISSLERLAKRWPETLWLFSASGSLLVMRNDECGGHAHTTDGTVDQNYILATINIPNDGGDF